MQIERQPHEESKKLEKQENLKTENNPTQRDHKPAAENKLSTHPSTEMAIEEPPKVIFPKKFL